jgi:1-acyl-sn-glycerol-3-phosphate acyltransferase
MPPGEPASPGAPPVPADGSGPYWPTPARLDAPDDGLIWLLYNLAQASFTAAWTAGWITAALVETVRRGEPETALAMARQRWGPGLLHGAGARLQIEGGDEVDWSRPHLFVCNHQSMIDVPIAFVSLGCNVRFIAKRELGLLPLLGHYMRATGMIFVDRGDGERARQSIQAAADRMRAGASVLAFPEGTRSIDGSIGPFKKGAFVVAIAAQVPVVPVAIEGAQRVLPRDGFRVRPGVVRVRIGSPIPTAGLGYDDRDALLTRVREALIVQHRLVGGRS